jgi:predicted Zn-ribbon and HTH transcriptional regulator
MIKLQQAPNFRFAFCERNGFDFAYNWKVFTTETVEKIWRTEIKSEPPPRPHFLIQGYKRIPTQPVALLIGNPVTKFVAACHEDGIEPVDAIQRVSDGKFPSFHFFPQSRFLSSDQPVFLWKAPNHIAHLWEALDLGDPPEIYSNEIDFKYESKLREIYKDDFELYESIIEPKTLAESKSGVNPTLWEQMRNVGFAVGKFSASGFKPTPPEILTERESICRSCDQWDAAALRNTGRCKKCGCSTWAKLRMATERCPLGKWETVSVEDSKQ